MFIFTGVEGNQIRHLDSDIMNYRCAIFADSTKATYSSQLKSYLRFCVYFKLQPVPVTQLNLCRYAVFLARSLSFSSIPAYLNVVRIIHLEAGLDNPLNNWQLKSLLKGIKRVIGKPPNQKLPITLDILRTIHSKLEYSISSNKAFWAASLVAFYAFLRKSTLLPKSSSDINVILVQDVKFCTSGAVLSIKHTKTIQYHERILNIPLPRLNYSSPLCPVKALEDLLHDNKPQDSDPLFCYMVADKLIPLTHDIFVKSLKFYIKLCGLDSKLYSGHSFRRGGATHAFSLNISPLLIKAQGDWKSDAYLRYIDIPMKLRWETMMKLAASAEL